MEIPIHDIKGKELGKFILTDEVDEVLKNTGLSLVMEYDSTKTEVIGYLH